MAGLPRHRGPLLTKWGLSLGLAAITKHRRPSGFTASLPSHHPGHSSLRPECGQAGPPSGVSPWHATVILSPWLSSACLGPDRLFSKGPQSLEQAPP